MKISLLPKKTWKQTTLKAINVVSMVTLIINMSMVGVFITPKVAEASSNPSADLDQCANFDNPGPSASDCNPINWVNGNLGASKARYFEGDSVPYRMRFENLSLGSHMVEIEWDTTKSSKHALDYLTTYNRTVTTANPCAGVSGCSASTTFAIPADSQVTGAGVTPIAGNFTLFGGTITAVSAYSYADGTGFSGDKSASITLTFTASAANPVLAWGGHIANRSDWGEGNSAVAISGSPYHMRLIDLDGSGGNQDRSLSAEAVIFPGSVTIVKQATPEGPQSFAYTTNLGSGFSLVDDGTSSNTKVFPGIIDFTDDNTGPLSYTVTESATPGWILDSIICTDPTSNSTGNTGTRTATIELAEGENISCTFANSADVGSLTVNKQVDTDGNGTFEGGNTEANTLNFDWGIDAETPARNMGTTASGVSTGTHSVSESPVANYHFVGWYPTGSTQYSCTNPQGTTLPASVSITKDTTTSITLCNARNKGNLTVNKEVDTDGDGDIDLYNTGWTFDIQGGEQNIAMSATRTLLTGSYTVNEDQQTNYHSSGWTCSDQTSGVGETLTVNVPTAGVTCTFTNTRDTGSLKIVKYVDSGSATPDQWSFTIQGYGTKTPSQGQDYVIFNNLPTGNYSASESALTDYHQVSTTCTNVAVTKDNQAVCNFHNAHDTGNLTVNKAVDTNGDGQVDAVNPQGWTWDIQGGEQNIAMGATRSLFTGSYTVSEDQHSNYHSTGWMCDDGTSGVGEQLSVEVTTEGVTCTFTNTRDTGWLKVIKHVINDNGGNADASDFNVHVMQNASDVTGSPAAGSETGTMYMLLTGTYDVSEDTPIAGYTQASVVCDGQETSSVTIANANTEQNPVVCTITNDDQAPTITLNKIVTNNNGGNASENDFGLSIGGTPVDSGQILEVDANTPYALNEAGLEGYSFVSLTGAGCPTELGDTVTLDEGEDVTCTITNDDQAPTITLVKEVVNNNGGNASENDFGLSIGGTSVDSGQTLEVDANTPYALNEAGLSGYSFVSLTGEGCPTQLGDTVTLDEGEDVTCTITNDDDAAIITLIKEVTNNNGGNAGENDFGLTIGGTPVTSGQTLEVDANTPYALNEAGLTGYTFVSLTGDEGCPTELGGEVTLNEGESITCTITNDDVAPTITFNKVVINDNGGNAGENDFGLSIGGTPVDSGQTLEVDANTPYSLDEAGLDGYTFVSLTGDEGCPQVLGGTVTLNEGEDIFCTITNDDQAPTITLVKEVVNNNGGNASENDFGLSIGGTSVDSGQTLEVDANTPYALNEAGLDGYTFVSLTGDENCPAQLGGEVTLNEGEDITCTITNDDQAPTITLIKNVINDNNGPADENDFGLTIGGTPVNSGQTLEVDANTSYALNEEGQFGYTFVSLTGEGCPEELGATVTLNEGQDITCTITNDDIQPKLTVTKIVDNQGFEGKDVEDFDLFVDETQVFSGDQNGFDAGEYVVSEDPDANYTATISGDCDANGNVTLGVGEEKECTITNVRNTTRITFDKVVVDENELGPGTEEDWTFTINGVEGSFKDGDTVTLPTNTAWDVSESDPFPGLYGLTDASGACSLEEGQIVLDTSAESKTCVIENTRLLPTLGLEKTAPSQVNAGDNISYTINWSVSGDSIATDVMLTDQVPTNTTFVSADNGGVYDSNTNTVTWDLGTKNPGDNGTVHMVVKVNSPITNGTVITNTAVIDSNETGPVEAQAQTTVGSGPVLGITKVVDVTTFVNPGATVNYTVTIKNTGTDTAINVQLTDLLPAGFTFTDFGGSSHTWTLGNLAAGAQTSVTYKVTVGASVAAGTYENLAVASADNHGNVTAKVPVEVRIPQVLGTEPKLTIEKTVNVPFANPGQTITYTVVVKNIGDGFATNAQLQDVLPAGFVFADDNSTTKTWILGDMAPGASQTITYKVKINSTVLPGNYENFAVVWAENHGQITDSVSLEVRKIVVLGLPTTGAQLMNLVYIFVAGLLLLASLYLLSATVRKTNE